MNTKAIISSVLFGSSLLASSAAMATPSVTVSAAAHGSYDTTVACDHRSDHDGTAFESPPIMPPTGWNGSWDGGRPLPPVYRPVTLASGLTFADDGRKFITVGSQAGRFEALQINAAGGRTFIKQVYVQFADGQEQVVRNVDHMLAGNDSLTLDLDGNRRAIRRIVVYGHALNHGWRRGTGSFTVTGA